jgi:hypothetical protein
MSLPRIIIISSALVLFSSTVAYHGIVGMGGMRIAMILLVAVITPIWALYEWYRAYKSTPEAKCVADRLISAFVVAMFGLASVVGGDFVQSQCP